jgi:hypothetical protein
MIPELLASLPTRPFSEVEWEDLLVRLELMPRALRILLEDRDADDADVARVIHRLASREEAAARYLEAAAGLEPRGRAEVQDLVLEELALDHFVRVRARNFAMVQRRGVEVWNWSIALDEGDSVTVYQVLARLANADVEALGEIRNRATIGDPAC